MASNNMVNKKQNLDLTKRKPQKDRNFEIELHQVPIIWDLEGGSFSFFGIDSALFWTDPSLLNMLLPLAEEIGNDLFRLLIAYSSSFGTEEDYHAMISTLGDNFQEGFLAWGKGVSSAGWGTFEMPEYHYDGKQATVIVKNSWEISMQRNLPPEKRWGSPFLQGKIIGIFNHAFGTHCWADDTCYFDSGNPNTVFEVYASKKTIKDELRRLRHERMIASQLTLATEVERKTAELKRAKLTIENYSKYLEQRVADRTVELTNTNQQLHNEIEIRKAAEAKKEILINDLQKTIREVKVLKGLLPICASCKKVRDDKGYWNQIESYIQAHSDAEFSHGICPQCAKKLYPDIDLKSDAT